MHFVLGLKWCNYDVNVRAIHVTLSHAITKCDTYSNIVNVCTFNICYTANPIQIKKMDDKKLQDVDLYELLGINVDCSTQDVKRAYRKKALSCHPDKNPDNPKAAELFHELSKALEILTDDSARAAYDKVLRAKKAAKIRHRELDSRRKKLKEDLEERERRAHELATKKTNFDSRTDEEKFQAEIERLRKEGSKQLEEEVEYVRQQVQREKETMRMKDTNSHRLTLRWKADKDDPTNGGYSYDMLHTILSKYGDVLALVVLPKKNGRALVEYETRDSAEMSLQLEKGLSSNPMSVEWLGSSQAGKTPSRNGPRLADLRNSEGDEAKSGIFPSVDKEPRAKTDTNFPTFSFSPNIQNAQPEPVEREFEDVVLRRMRQAEERKRLTSELKDDE